MKVIRQKHNVAVSVEKSGTAISLNGPAAQNVSAAILTDNRGDCVMQGDYNRDKQSYTMQFSIPPGVYLMHLLYDDGSRGCQKIQYKCYKNVAIWRKR